MSHPLHTIKAYEVVAPYTLRLTFDDHTAQVIDFTPLLRGELYGPLHGLDYFNRVRLDRETGTIVWPNGADFDPATLHDWDEVGEAMIEMARGWPETVMAGE